MHKSIHVSTGPVSLAFERLQTKSWQLVTVAWIPKPFCFFRPPIYVSASYMLASSSSPAPTVLSVCKPEKHTTVIAKQSCIHQRLLAIECDVNVHSCMCSHLYSFLKPVPPNSGPSGGELSPEPPVLSLPAAGSSSSALTPGPALAWGEPSLPWAFGSESAPI